MKPQVLMAAALVASQLAAGPAFAQDNGTTSSVPAAGQDAADYLTTDNLQDFFTDPNLKTMKSADEVKRVFEAKGVDAQAKLRAACAVNEESRFADFCKALPST